jgi:hypothetical protein
MPQWIVEMKCVVRKEVVCECETEEEVRKNPWVHAVDERETGQDDWEVLRVKEDE